MRACGSCTKLLVTGSTPCVPATKMKSPALTPRLQVPSALMAPGGSSVLTPFGDCDHTVLGLAAEAIAVTQRRIERGIMRDPDQSGRQPIRDLPLAPLAPRTRCASAFGAGD